MNCKNGASMKIKICGITNLEDALLAEKLGADAVGFIFYKPSRRCISPETAKIISKVLSSFTLKVGVFVNEAEEEINKITEIAKLNLIQLHGDEKPEIIPKLILPSIKSFRVNENYNFTNIENYKCDNYLFDTFSQDEFGGTGNTFDWDLIPISLLHRSIIAGGVSENNIEEIFTKYNPYAVDISSSIEESIGKKNHNKMKNLFKKINQIRS